MFSKRPDRRIDYLDQSLKLIGLSQNSNCLSAHHMGDGTVDLPRSIHGYDEDRKFGKFSKTREVK